MSRNHWPAGLITALVTPMNDDGIHAEGVRQLKEIGRAHV